MNLQQSRKNTFVLLYENLNGNRNCEKKKSRDEKSQQNVAGAKIALANSEWQ